MPEAVSFCRLCGEPGDFHVLADCIHNVALTDNRRALHLIADYVATLKASWPTSSNQYRALSELVDAIHTLARTHPNIAFRSREPK